jgi:hypothetical protein
MQDIPRRKSLSLWRNRAFSLSAFLAIGILQSTCGAPANGVAQNAAEPILATVQLGSKPGREIPTNFMGLSHEWGNARHFLGSEQTGENLIYRRLIANLTAFGSGPLVLRIGGNSTDATKEPTPAYIQPFVDLAKTTGAHFILGVNLGAADPQLAARQTQMYLAQMPPSSVDAIEIGNEPDLYHRNGRRGPDYTVESYRTEIDRWHRPILPLLPAGVRLAGPAWAASSRLAEETRALEAHSAGSLGVFTMHFYQTNPGAHPSPDQLLEPRAATEGPEQMAAAVAISHNNGIPFRLDEFSSIGNEGVHGVSDDFATALWAVDTMFEYVRIGVDGINWEASDGNFCSPFYFDVDQTRRPNVFNLKYVSPLYSGLLFFQAATGNHAHLSPVRVETQFNIKVWATTDAAGVNRIVVLNKELHRGGAVVLSAPGFTSASIRTLTAPSAEATSGVHFAGQTFDGSRDGGPLGKEREETVLCVQDRCVIPVSAASGALITLQR